MEKNKKKTNKNSTIKLGDGKELNIKNPTKGIVGKIVIWTMIIGMAGLTIVGLIWQLYQVISG